MQNDATWTRPLIQQSVSHFRGGIYKRGTKKFFPSLSPSLLLHPHTVPLSHSSSLLFLRLAELPTACSLCYRLLPSTDALPPHPDIRWPRPTPRTIQVAGPFESLLTRLFLFNIVDGGGFFQLMHQRKDMMFRCPLRQHGLGNSGPDRPQARCKRPEHDIQDESTTT